jgi:hypothetical protein
MVTYFETSLPSLPEGMAKNQAAAGRRYMLKHYPVTNPYRIEY